MKTISELIWEEIDEIRKQKEHWDAAYLSDKLITLSAYYANLSQHIANLENTYLKLLDFTLEENLKMPVNRAEIKAKSGDEYLKYKQALNLEKALIEQIRAIKRYVRVKEGEWEASKNL